jgi:hypothetical protein
MSFFFFCFTKSENRRAKQVLPGGKGMRKGCGRVNTVQILEKLDLWKLFQEWVERG